MSLSCSVVLYCQSERAGQVRIVVGRAASARAEEDNGSNLPDTSTILSVFPTILSSVPCGCCTLSVALKSLGECASSSPYFLLFYAAVVFLCSL